MSVVVAARFGAVAAADDEEALDGAGLDGARYTPKYTHQRKQPPSLIAKWLFSLVQVVGIEPTTLRV